MDLITLFILAYLIGKGLSSGSDKVKDNHDKNKKKLSPGKDGDKTSTGTNLAAGALTAGTAVFTFASGFKNGWKEAWPEARQVVTAQREKNKAAKEAAKNGGALGPDGRPPLTEADGAKVVGRKDGSSGDSSTGPDSTPTTPDPADAGSDSSNPGGISMANPNGTIEVVSVDSLIIWLQNAVEFANRETDDATAAVRRIRDLEAKVENAYNAAAAAKYDRQVLTKLAALREQLAKLRTAREDDARNSADASGNAQISAQNVITRHGGINEAVAAAPVDMAESGTYVD